MSVPDLTAPPQVIVQLWQIDQDLANRQNDLEEYAEQWFRAKRDQEHDYSVAYLNATGTVAERQAQAKIETYTVGVEAEAKYEALKAVVRVLETRASIAQSILRAQGR